MDKELIELQKRVHKEYAIPPTEELYAREVTFLSMGYSYYLMGT